MSTTTLHRVGETLHHRDSSAAELALKELEHERHLELAELQARRTHIYAMGRILLAALFVVSGAVKWAHFGSTVHAMGEAGLADPALLLPFALLVELLGGAMLAVGYKVRIAATALIGYVAMVTLLVHWDLALEANRAQAITNVALVGALLMLVGHGSGAPSLDKWLARRARLAASGAL